LEDDTVICPYHDWRFNVKTGASEEISGFYIDKFAVKVDGKKTYIAWSGS